METTGSINLIENTTELYRQGISIMKAKNADYAGNEDVTGLRNFELSANVAKVKMSQGILVRLMDKMSRIGNLLTQEAKVADEKIQDTILDAINYLAILEYAIKEESKTEKPKSS